MARNSLGKQQHRVIVEVDGYSGDASNRQTNAYFAMSSYQPTVRATASPSMPSISFDQKKAEKTNKPKVEVQAEVKAVAPPPVKSPTPPREEIKSVTPPKEATPPRSKTPESSLSSRSSRKSSPLSDVPIPAPIESIKSATPPPASKSPTPTPSGEGPVLVKGLKDDTHESEAYVMLEVEFENADRVEWSLNNGPLPESTVVRETENGSKIRIRSFTSNDAGLYKATGFNKTGETSSTCHLAFG